jgi:Flp pilus assembly protein TadG
VTGLPQGPARFGRSPARRGGSESGQSLVEFTLVLVPLLLILFGILELGLVMFDKVTVVNDAREAARLASVNDASGKTLLGDAPAGSSLTFTCATDPNSGNAQGSFNVGDKITAHVTYVHSFVTPLISTILGSTINLSSNATMTLDLVIATDSVPAASAGVEAERVALVVLLHQKTQPLVEFLGAPK